MPSQLPATLRLEPIRFGSGLPLEFLAGECIPETGAYICNGAGQTMVRGVVAGLKQSFGITQRLWKLGSTGESDVATGFVNNLLQGPTF